MKVLIIFAHPDKRSLNHAILQSTVDYLKEKKHEVKVTDLYEEQWMAGVDARDFLDKEDGARLFAMRDSGNAYLSGMLSEDIKAEQAKVHWADLIIFQFPMWWYSMPALMKGWVDRVLTKEFSYTGEKMFDTAPLAGKKAFIVSTVGVPKGSYTTGQLGDINDVFFPIQQGTFALIGFKTLPPIIGYMADSRKSNCFGEITQEIRERIHNIDTVEPLKTTGGYSSAV